MRSQRIAVIALLAAAALFYFLWIGRADIVTDESSYATRAIKLVDFDFGIKQPTPWQWVGDIPWWMHLSFHDHPPLVFLIQHSSIQFFGEHPTAIRIPSAIAGVISVWLLYLIGRRLFSPATGLSAAALFAFTVNHVWISRIGLQESLLIPLMLGAVLLFLMGLEKPRWLVGSGVLLGFAFLAKYLAVILIPIFLTTLALHRRDLLTSRWFLFAVSCFLLIISPVIIYNIQLYRNFGHFDFQISMLARQDVEAWSSRPAQEAMGNVGNRAWHFIPWLWDSSSPSFLLLAGAGLAYTSWSAFRTSGILGSPTSGYRFLLISVGWLIPFLIFVGPAYRFQTILTPWFALIAGAFCSNAFDYTLIRTGKKLVPCMALGGLAAILIWEIFYSWNTLIALRPIGERPWTYAKIRNENDTWGFNQLDAFFNEKFSGKMPEIAVAYEFQFAKNILEERISEGRAKNLEPVPWGIVYDGSFNFSAQLWVFLRRAVYQGWPVADHETFLVGGGEQFFREQGVKKLFVVNALEGRMAKLGIKPIEIKNPKGEIAFRIYEYALEE